MEFSKEVQAEISRLNEARERELELINSRYDAKIRVLIRDRNQ